MGLSLTIEIAMRVKPPPFWYAGCRAILNGIPDAKGGYAGCHFWSKLDSDLN